MTSVYRETVIDADPAEVWAVLSDFENGPTTMAPGFVTGCRLAAPDVRVVTFAGGDEAWERLIAVDEQSRRVVWSFFDGWATPIHDNASFQVHTEGENRTRLVWIHDVLPDALAGPLGTAMDGGLDTIRRTLEAGATSPAR